MAEHYLDDSVVHAFWDKNYPARIEIAFHPLPHKPRRHPKARRAVLMEVEGRSGDFNEGGSSKRKVLTAYREQTVRIAGCQAGEVLVRTTSHELMVPLRELAEPVSQLGALQRYSTNRRKPRRLRRYALYEPRPPSAQQ